MLNFRPIAKLNPVFVAVRVRGNSNGFKYRHADGTLRRAAPGEIVKVDEETLAAVRKRVELVVK